jgi:hypothetical protein
MKIVIDFNKYRLSGMYPRSDPDNNKKFEEAKNLYLKNKQAIDLILIKAIKEKSEPRTGTIQISTMYFKEALISQMQFIIDKIIDDYIFLDLKQVGN